MKCYDFPKSGVPYMQAASRQGEALEDAKIEQVLLIDTRCDEARPVCNRCQKSNLVCHSVEEDCNIIFLNENEYAVGRRKRPQGPKVKRVLVTRDNPQIATSSKLESLSRYPDDALPIEIPPAEPQSLLILPALDISVDDQALTYYSRHHVEVPHGLPRA
jgi:hypothetical protein